METAILTESQEISIRQKIIKLTEIILLFVGTPIMLWLELPLWSKGSYFFICIGYVIWLMVKKDKLNIVEKKLVNPTRTLLDFGIKFMAIAGLSTLFLYFSDPDSLFNVISEKPLLWLSFSGIYVVLSVIPQEIIYRYFFLKRYRTLFKNKWTLILVNASLFSLAHIWFNSWIVLAFTFIGGILFLQTYRKTHSLWLVILEHSLYGIWLYTVGYGELFKFAV
ncbi:MAG: CPBP family intramembrane glutamic endopeptidase [Flavobacteriales bacterium]